MNRIIQSIEPSYPWLWTAILTKESSVTGSVDPNQSISALSAVSAWATTLQKALTGGLSTFLWSGTGKFGTDVNLSALIQDVQLPAQGFTLQYEDLGFCRYPTIGQINTDPITLNYLENADNIISRYYQDWAQEIAPILVSLKSANAASQQLDVGAASLFAPLATVSRTLFIIKTKRDLALGLVDYITTVLNKKIKGSLASLSSGFTELPVQIYCFPKVFPQKVVEAKLDKSETNSFRTLQVLLERVPTIITSRSDGLAATNAQLLMSATMGWAKAASAVSETLLGIASSAINSIAEISTVSKLYTQGNAATLVDISKQPETFDAR